MKITAPFLKAFGATDLQMHNASAETLELMPEAGTTMRYALNVMSTFITTSLYEHDVMNICDSLDIPMGNINCTELSLDAQDMSRHDARALRDAASIVTSLRIPKTEYLLDVPMELDPLDVKILKTMDDLAAELMAMESASSMMRSMTSVGSNDKAYALLEIRRKTSIDLDGTAYIGSDTSDYQSMELVKESGGLALSFNGADFAVRGSNVAILSNDCTVAGVLLQEFYNGGIEAVLDLVNNWDRKSLKKGSYSDPHLMEAMLAANPKKLPEVVAVNRQNVEEISKKSTAYRKRILGFKSKSSDYHKY
jgi:predicted HAD superfamily phosphohydrolase